MKTLATLRKELMLTVANIVEPLGFERRKTAWNRARTPYTDVLELQTSKTHDKVTFNAGVLRTDLYEKVWKNPMPNFVEEPSCTVRARIGNLLDGNDKWWEIAETGTISDIQEKISLYVLPFFDRMHSDGAMADFLAESNAAKGSYPPPAMFLALLKAEHGDTTSACDVLQQISKRTVSSAWRDRVEELHREIGCE